MRPRGSRARMHDQPSRKSKQATMSAATVQRLRQAKRVPEVGHIVTSVALAAYVPEGKVEPHHFAVATLAAPADAPPGGVLLQMMAMTVDPFTRTRMREEPTTDECPSFTPGMPVETPAIAWVIKSDRPGLVVGDLVACDGSAAGMMAWQEQVALPAKEAAKLVSIDNPRGFPVSYFLGALGMPGFTAWWLLKSIAEPRAGEVAYVSSGAGAIGMVAGQLLKQVYGCRLVASVGSDDKALYLTRELGFDYAFNYKTTSVRAGLAKHCPAGIDICFDNVGGETLEAALDCCSSRARVVVCGATSTYDALPWAGHGIQNMFKLVTKQIKVQGLHAWIGMAQPELRAAFDTEMAELVSSGRVRVVETVTRGLHNAPQAFCNMMAGKGMGTCLVLPE